MQSHVITAFALAGLAMTGAASADEALAKKSACLTCHAVDVKKVGPAYKDVAAKYKGQKDARTTLVAKLKAGTAHPAVKASDADLETLVKWVLAR